MEFFEIIEVKTTEAQLQEKLVIENLEDLNEEMFLLEALNEHESKIGTIWGEFTLFRNNIKGGVRFALSDCPNALAWTITTGYPPNREGIVIHATVNRTRKPAEFIEEVKDFIALQKEGLQKMFA